MFTSLIVGRADGSRQPLGTATAIAVAGSWAGFLVAIVAGWQVGLALMVASCLVAAAVGRTGGPVPVADHPALADARVLARLRAADPPHRSTPV